MRDERYERLIEFLDSNNIRYFEDTGSIYYHNCIHIWVPLKDGTALVFTEANGKYQTREYGCKKVDNYEYCSRTYGSWHNNNMGNIFEEDDKYKFL